MTKTDLYQQVTDKIVAALERGVAPWVRPWASFGSSRRSRTLPFNGATGHQYRGANVVILWCEMMERGWSDPRFYSYAQAQQRGGQVRKGEKACSVIFFKPLKIRELDQQSGDYKDKTIPLIRAFSVFNRDQIEWNDEVLPQPEEVQSVTSFDEATKLVKKNDPNVRHGGTLAFYAPQGDYIQMPQKATFVTEGNYWGTLLHELSHWTGHSSRLGRPLCGQTQDREQYAKEELIAEMGSAFLCAHVGIPGNLQHPEYIASWLNVLKNDKRAFFAACREAQKVADYLVKEKAEEPGTTDEGTSTEEEVVVSV